MTYLADSIMSNYTSQASASLSQTMQFRDYIFKNNPEKISVTNSKNIVSHFLPGRGEVFQDLGKKARVVTCNGSFWGASFAEALDQVIEFRKSSDDVGMLYLPNIEPFSARLIEFAYDAFGDGRIIPYSMRFVEEVALNGSI